MWGHGIDYKWVWKSFLRGHNVLFMDPWGPLPLGTILRATCRIIRAIGTRARPCATRPSARPHGYGEDGCRAARLLRAAIAWPIPARSILVYLPEGGQVTVDLSDARGDLAVEWIHPIEGALVAGRRCPRAAASRHLLPVLQRCGSYLHTRQGAIAVIARPAPPESKLFADFPVEFEIYPFTPAMHRFIMGPVAQKVRICEPEKL